MSVETPLEIVCEAVMLVIDDWFAKRFCRFWMFDPSL